MFIGHYGVALALRKAEPKLSLGWLFLGAQLVDVFWTVFIFFGVEEVRFQPGITQANAMDFVSYPYTHSLLAAWVWAAIAYAVVRWSPLLDAIDRARAALVMAIAVVSHWFLDLIVHRPDLPIGLGDGEKVGFELWDNLLLSLILEGVVFVGGLWIYLSATKPLSKKKGKLGIYIFAAFLILVFTATTLSGDTPPDVPMMAVTGFVMYLVLAWIAGAVDRRRTARG